MITSLSNAFFIAFYALLGRIFSVRFFNLLTVISDITTAEIPAAEYKLFLEPQRHSGRALHREKKVQECDATMAPVAPKGGLLKNHFSL